MTFPDLLPRRRFALVTATFLVLMMIQFLTGVMQSESPETALFMSTGVNMTFSGHNRKLLQQAAEVEPNRIGGNTCSTSDIFLNQGPTDPLPSGIPTYTVEIMNVCVTGCDISGIHLSCGWFSSARLINPKIFRRLSFDDCLVNDGQPLLNGHTISFQYANSFPYPLSVSSVVC